MTDHTTAETARALLHRHGLPEDVIDGTLCLHAQELAALQRLRMDELDLTGQKARLVGRIVDLIDPTKTASPAVSRPSVDRAALRELIAAAIWARTPDAEPTPAGLIMGNPHGIADAVLPVLPAHADRASVLREAASRAWEFAQTIASTDDDLGMAGSIEAELRRMADETPATEPADRAAVLLPAWEAVYEPGNVSTYLIGYANDQDAATGMAEAWLRSQAEVTGRLEWLDEQQMATGRHDRWFELIERHDGGADTGPGIVVRRMADETQPAETSRAPALPGPEVKEVATTLKSAGAQQS